MENTPEFIREALLAALVGLSGVAVYILRELKNSVDDLNEAFREHIADEDHHCSPDKIKANRKT